MNILIASGHLGADPDTRFTTSGTAITTFSLPVRQGWGDRETTSWVKCKLFGKKGTNVAHGMAKHLAKGKLVTVQGEIVLAEWQNKEGQTVKTLECLVRDLVLSFSDEPTQAAPAPSQDPPAPSQDPEPGFEFEDDVPF